MSFRVNTTRPECPPGYFIGRLLSEHAPFVSGLWRFGKYTINPSKIFESIIMNKFPSSAVFEDSNKEKPVGWILSYPSGHIGHIMILQEHRKKHLFKPLAWDLCKAMLNEEYIPELASDNVDVISFAKNNGFKEISKGRRLIYQAPNHAR